MNKIVYIVKTKLHYYPPCVSQIRMIKRLGYDIDVLYGSSNESALNLLKIENINCIKICDMHDENIGKLKKMLEWINYRKELWKIMKKYPSDTIYWFGTGESIIPMKGKLNGKCYVLSLLELLDHEKLKRNLIKKLAQNANAVTVCEETRGYLMQSWWNLKKLPYVFPNKPFDQITNKNADGKVKESQNIIKRIKEKNVILYQGMIQNTEELVEFAKALKSANKDYILLLMGLDRYNSVSKIKQIYDKTIFVDYIPAPHHLEVTSYAKIGIVFYRPDSLNKAFCAPNKIYEYSGFGIPIIGNSIPGLKNTVGKYGAAECINLTQNNIIEAINKIENNYEIYSQNAKNFFESTDNLETTKQLLEDLK